MFDTRTRGIDVVGHWSLPLQPGTLNLTAGYNRNKTDVTRVAPNPAALTALGANLERMGRDERGRIEEGFPRDKLALTANWQMERWDFNLGATRYGSFITRHASNPAQDQEYDAKAVFDVSANFRPLAGWTATLGVDNVADAYPEKTIFVNSTFGQIPYSLQSPFGFNGRYYYGSLRYQW